LIRNIYVNGLDKIFMLSGNIYVFSWSLDKMFRVQCYRFPKMAVNCYFQLHLKIISQCDIGIA